MSVFDGGGFMCLSQTAISPRGLSNTSPSEERKKKTSKAQQKLNKQLFLHFIYISGGALAMFKTKAAALKLRYASRLKSMGQTTFFLLPLLLLLLYYNDQVRICRNEYAPMFIKGLFGVISLIGLV